MAPSVCQQKTENTVDSGNYADPCNVFFVSWNVLFERQLESPNNMLATILADVGNIFPTFSRRELGCDVDGFSVYLRCNWIHGACSGIV